MTAPVATVIIGPPDIDESDETVCAYRNETACAQCLRHLPDRIGLTIIENDDDPDGRGAADFGFCSKACFTLWVRRHFIEAQ